MTMTTDHAFPRGRRQDIEILGLLLDGADHNQEHAKEYKTGG